jgi:hypothetical protein
MALDVSTLANQLASNFAAPAADAAGCGQQWADAVEAYASAVVPPSLSVSAAAATLASSLASAFSAPSAIPGMESAFTAFGSAVASGMAPTFTGTPPGGPVGFASIFGSALPETHGEAASNIASAIHAWMLTGTATLVAPPNTVTPWS